MIAASPHMTNVQLFLFDPEDVPRVRVRPPVDKELQKRRREARQRHQSRLRLLPAVAIFFESDGQVCHLPGMGVRLATEDHELTRAERLACKEKQRLLRKSRDEKRRAKAIFLLWDLQPDWISGIALRRMDEEIERAKAEVQKLWSPNERRKRLLGLNATEKDPNEHWTPMVAFMQSVGFDSREE